MRETLSYMEVKNKLNSIISPRDRALCCILYGSAGRINEVLKLRKSDIRMENNYLLISLRTEKNPNHPERIVPIPLKEEWVVKPIADYLEVCDGRLFNFSDRLARNITRKCMDCNPHFLRHTRLTHLVSIYRADEHRLRMIAGWVDTRPAYIYVHLNWKDTKDIFE